MASSRLMTNEGLGAIILTEGQSFCMRFLRPTLFAVLLIVSNRLSSLQALAQQESLLPPDLNQNSSLTEILSWLDENAFPYAQLGLRAKGSHTQSVVPFKSGNPIPEQERIFSEGFHVKFVNGCHVTLSNEKVAIIDPRKPAAGILD